MDLKLNIGPLDLPESPHRHFADARWGNLQLSAVKLQAVAFAINRRSGNTDLCERNTGKLRHRGRVEEFMSRRSYRRRRYRPCHLR
jgi:hypothetical protein